MAFTNSSLATMISISPNRSIGRYDIVNGQKIALIDKITKITVHHWAGVGTLETFRNIVMNPGREMSANYAIDVNGAIGLFCNESDRSWCSSSQWNDNRAITIEVANSVYGDSSGWPISDASYKALIRLCVDICKRNGIPKLEFTGDKNGSLTYHYMYASTGCPGPWIKAHTQDLCNKVNAELGSNNTTPLGLYTVDLKTGTPIYDSVDGAIVGEISASTKYTIIEEKIIAGYKYGKLKSGAGWVVIEKPQPTPSSTAVSYTVSLKSSDLVYGTAGGVQTGTVGANGVFTIVEESTINGIKYGKLKSGIGWVVVNTTTTSSTTSTGFKSGDLVKIAANAVYYNGGGIPEWVKNDKWYISSISGDRAVLGSNESRNRDIQSPINTKYITKVSSGATVTPIKVGDWVKVTNNIIYGTTQKFSVLVSKYKVLELKGDRAVISSDGVHVTTAISVNNIKRI